MSKIVSLRAENFKRLKAVEIEPDGTTVVIKGRNAQGKSSVLDAIMAALAGKKGAKDLVRPIRDGESKAIVRVELEELVVERRWTQGGSSVTVSPKGGNAKLNSPQKVLDELIGSLSFDPLNFAESDPKSQVATLIDLIGREQFDRLAEERRATYDARTEANREAKRLRAQRDGIGPVEPAEKVDMAALMGEIGAANKREALTREWNEVDAEIKRLTARRAEIEREGLELPKTRTLPALQVALEEVEQTNEQARAYEQARELDGLLDDFETSAADYTRGIMALDLQRSELIARADLPVDGLTFDDEGVAYHGVPFVQASAAERLKVSVAMAMALNPDLRVICIRDASLLDEDSRRALVEMATEHDYQIWYEVVGKSGDVGVVIEDGEVEA